MVRTNDPQASARIVLRIPQVLGTAESAWARPSAFASGVPNVGDTVYVTFEGGDLAQPVYTPQTTIDSTTTPIPKPPTALDLTPATVVTAEGVTLVNLSAVWVAPTENQDGSVPVHLAGYVVYLSTDGVTYDSGDYVDSASWIRRALLPGRTYFVRVAAVNEMLQRSATTSAAQVTVAAATPPSDSVLGQQSTTLTNIQTTLTTQAGQLDGKAAVYVQDTQPHDSNDPKDKGDVWIDTANNRVIKTYNGSDWILSDDTRLAQAVTDITSKITTFYAVAASAPTATAIGDLWIITDQNNKIKRASAVGAANWVDVTPKYNTADLIDWQSINTGIQGKIDGKAETYVQSGDPSAGATPAWGTEHAGDIWINNGVTPRVIKTWVDGTTKWIEADSRVAQAVTDITKKTTTYYTTTGTPTVPTGGFTEGDLWVDNGVVPQQIKRWTSGAWAVLDVVSSTYLQSRATNIITNGSGLLGNNTNFSTGFTFDKTDAPTGAIGAFKTALGSNASLNTDEFITVDPTKRWQMSLQAKQKGSSTTATCYGAALPYDSVKGIIGPNNYMFIAGTTTTLAAPLNPGDTTITLTSSANWYGTSGKPAGTNTYNRAIIFWDYTDTLGKAWGTETFSRNVTAFDMWADGGITGNVITLRTPWAGTTKPSGTSLSNATSGGSYIYMTGFANTVVPQTWTTFSSTITGVVSGGAGASFAAGWPPGTAYAKLGFLPNRVLATGSADPNSQMSFGLISFSDAAAASADAAAADQKAVLAQQSANGKSTSKYSPNAPAATDANVLGDIWFQQDSNGNVIGQWLGGGGTGPSSYLWNQTQISSDVIANLDVGKLVAGKMNANIVVSGEFATDDPGKQRTVMGSDGIQQIAANGAILTDLPNDPNKMARFSGIINAFGVTVNDGLELRGTGNTFAMASVTSLASVTGASATAAGFTVDWERYDAGLSGPQGIYATAGFHQEVDAAGAFAAFGFYGYGKVITPTGSYVFPEITTASGGKAGTWCPSSMAMVYTSGGQRMVMTGVGTAAGGSGVNYLRSYDVSTLTSGGTVAPVQKANLAYGTNDYGRQYQIGRCFSPTGTSTLQSQIAMADRNAVANTLTLRRFDVSETTFTQQGSDISVTNPLIKDETLSGVVYGSSAKMSFPGTDQNIWVVLGTKSAYAFTAAGARLPAFDFPMGPNCGVSCAAGSTASGANAFLGFRGYQWGSDGDGLVTKFTNIHWASTDSPVWWAGYSWFDSDPTGTGTHETPVSVLASVTMKQRARLTVTTPPLPDPATGQGTARGVDDVNSFRIYMQRGSVKPTNATLWKQATQPADLATSVTLTAMPQWSGTTNPLTASTFPSSAPAVIQSTDLGSDSKSKLIVRGDGYLHGESLDINGTGATALSGKAVDQLYYVARAQGMLSGGGKITVSTSGEVRWSSRLITIGLGRGPNIATAGFFEITCPATGVVIPGVGGAANKTVTANGIPLNSWESIYYVLPFGSANTSVDANLRVVNYTTTFTVPNDWVLVATRVADSGTIAFNNGRIVSLGCTTWEDTGWVDCAAALTEQPGFTTTLARYRIKDGLAEMSWAGSNTTAGRVITTSATGDGANIDVTTGWPTDIRPSGWSRGLTPSISGPPLGYAMTGAGVLTITGGFQNQTLSALNLSVTGSWFL
ncbi:phage baseplate assembly protein V [Terracoccus sp. 273MFTsu3.1]|uniref:phage baseplate assembly protein V n=1 Tax=Terracoccus sp. 273MFTsu3.1 TaxID=1172188 RepID=UPI00037FB45D|nr:phage baseplate assembly protein V [Terracoccus sp. 273MFTsu3.1]